MILQATTWTIQYVQRFQLKQLVQHILKPVQGEVQCRVGRLDRRLGDSLDGQILRAMHELFMAHSDCKTQVSKMACWVSFQSQVGAAMDCHNRGILKQAVRLTIGKDVAVENRQTIFETQNSSMHTVPRSPSTTEPCWQTYYSLICTQLKLQAAPLPATTQTT